MAVLNEKQVSYDITYIDLRNKPDWFLEMSPTGKVPVLQTPDEEVLFESAVINEYLDEVHEPHFMPENPLERARSRMWVEFTSYLFGDVYRLYTAADEGSARNHAAAAKTRLEKMAAAWVGPLFRGEQFSLVDAAVAPAIMRLDWVAQLDPSLDVFAGNDDLIAWRDSLLTRDSVKDSVLPNIFEIFVDSMKGTDRYLTTKL